MVITTLQEITLLLKNKTLDRTELLDLILNDNAPSINNSSGIGSNLQIIDFKVHDGQSLSAGDPSAILAFNEKTIVQVLGEKYNLVILLDCTDSMKTTESKVLASIAFETVCKFMEGLSCPFVINHSFTSETTRIDPNIHVSVIGVGKRVKTFLYNQHVCKNNMMELAEILYTAIIKFENENIADAKLDDSSPDSMMLNAEVADQADFLITSSMGNYNQQNGGSKNSINERELGSSPNEISMLDLGVSFLDLMKREGALPVMALITDGVSLDLFLSSDETNRAIIRDLINVCIVQTGSGQGYSPNSNFGHIPNNEDLRFLSLRADGPFVYAEDCPYVVDENESMTDPNFYHHIAATKKLSFSDFGEKSYLIESKPRPVDEIRSRFINTAVISPSRHSLAEHSKELSFPWLPDSKSPYIAEILCSYRNYKLLNISVDSLLRIRTNEGFVLGKINRTESQTKKMHKLEMSFILHLAPHVKIMYTLKFTIPNPSSTQLIGYIPPKGIRVEVNVLAHHSFAILFINVHNLESSKADSISSALYNKLVRLHSTLKGVSEADETLQILYQFNSPSALYLANQSNGSSAQWASPPSMELPSNYWNFLNQAVSVKPWLLDTFKIVILLRSTSMQSNMGARALASLQPSNVSSTESPRTRYQVSTIYLSRLLTSWASFSLSKTSHLSWVFENSLDASIPSGFCLLQVVWETESLMSLNLRFFSVGAKERTRIGLSFEKEVSALRHVNRHNPEVQIKPLYVCQKPLDSILIFYESIDDSAKNRQGNSVSDYFAGNKNLARSYLYRKSWVWFRDINQSSLPEGLFSHLVESSFILLYNTRISEGFSRAAESPGIVTFYKEIETDGDVCALQYVLLYDPSTDYLATEIWMEPSVVGCSAEKGQDLNKRVIGSIFSRDRGLLMGIYLFNLPSNDSSSFVEGLKPESNHELVPTVFHIPSFLTSHSNHIFYLRFGLVGCSATMEASDQSLSNFSIPFPFFNQSIPFSQALSQPSDLNLLQSASWSPNENLLFLFRSALSKASFCEFFIPSSNSASTLDSASSEFLKVVPPLDNSHLFYFPVNSETLFVFALNRKIPEDASSHFLATLFQVNKPSLDAKVPVAVNHLKFVSVTPDPGVDGSIVLKMMEHAQANAAPHENLFQGVEGGVWRTSTSNLDATLPATEIISHCFAQSLGKLIYSCAIRGTSMSHSDFARGLKGLKRELFLLDITNYLFLSTILPNTDPKAHLRHQQAYQAIVAADFESLVSLLFGGESLQKNVFFYRPKPIEFKTETTALAESPLFLSIYAQKLNGETIDCSAGLPDDTSLFAVEANNPNLFVPLDASNHPKLELVFEVFTSDVPESMSSSKSQAFSDLKKRVSVLVDDQVIKILLALPGDDFPPPTVSYIEGLFLERLSDVTMPSTIEQAGSLDQNLISFRFDLTLLHSECSMFVREDLPSFHCVGSPIRQCNEFYYSFDKLSDAPFWITFTLFDNAVELHLFCESREVGLRTSILTSAKDSIYKCAQRANQRFLLRELVETHVARDVVDPKYACFQSCKNDAVLFQLGCEERHSRFFPLHWRLRPALALNSIMSSLQALAIVNRRDCLIFSEEFYMLFEASPEDEKSISKTDLLDTPNRAKDRETSIAIDSGSSNTWGVTLRVFGIEAPSYEITNDFSKMIEAKIDTLTQQTLAAFIARNPVAKLSRADFDFLMPSTKQPTYNSTFLLVKEMENPHLFLVLLRQALLLFLLPCVGGEMCSLLSGYYIDQYGIEVKEEKDASLLNVLNLGNLSFLYNCVSKRQLTQLESKVGFGTACISLTPFDKNNDILFPSRASSALGTKHAVELDNSKFQVKECRDEEMFKSWPGYKVAVSIWSKGAIHLEPLQERIEMAFKYTLVDYAIESYYRSSKWYSISGRKRLPDLVIDQEGAVSGVTPELLISLDTHPNHVLSILPEVLQTGARRMNPVLQSITISSSLPLDTIALGMRAVLVDENLQALFFVKQSAEMQFSLLERMLKPSENKAAGHEYVIIGASDIFIDPLDSRKTSNASDFSSPLGSPRVPGSILPRKGSVDSLPESEPDGSKDRVSHRSSDELEEAFMFPDSFYPPFPVYGKRSSFFIVCLSGDLIHVSTYNWKKTESDKFFLKVIKILNWAKINSQFMIRKAWYSQAQVTKFNAAVSGFGEKAYNSTWGGKMPKLNFTVTFASKFRELDFIYHIGGYDATQLQTQIVDYLELFFKFGSRKGTFQLKEHPSRPSSSSAAPLSLLEMSKVLTSISLVHSSSSPIFFSDCCSDLLAKWQRLIETQSINAESLLNLGKSILTNPTTSRKIDISGEERWFKEMISHFGDCYVSYLESLGMVKSNINLKTQDSNQFGGAFAMNTKTLIHVPSIFMEKVFASGVILVQIGFYSYFASVNVLSFCYSTPSANASSAASSPESSAPGDGERADFEKECQKMKSHTHIVSFLYDFHLRYIQDKLEQGGSSHEIDFVKVLRHFVSLNPRKARFARNRIIHGYNDWNQESSDLFRYIVKNPSHSFLPILYQDTSIAISLTTDQLSQRKEKSPLPPTASSLKYTLILCEELEGDFKRLEYFILVIDKAHPFPHGEMNEIPELSSQLDVDPLKEYIEGGYYLSDILKSFEKVIETLIEKGLKDFGRDNLWIQLRDDPIHDSAEWTSLFLEKIAPQMRDITSQEGPLQFLLSSRLPWKEIFAYLTILFKKQVRLLNNSADQSKMDLIMFNPKNQAFLLYFRLQTLPDDVNHVLDVFAVSREGLRDPIEYQHLSEVIEAILHWLWHDL